MTAIAAIRTYRRGDAVPEFGWESEEDWAANEYQFDGVAVCTYFENTEHGPRRNYFYSPWSVDFDEDKTEDDHDQVLEWKERLMLGVNFEGVLEEFHESPESFALPPEPFGEADEYVYLSDLMSNRTTTYIDGDRGAGPFNLRPAMRFFLDATIEAGKPEFARVARNLMRAMKLARADKKRRLRVPGDEEVELEAAAELNAELEAAAE